MSLPSWFTNPDELGFLYGIVTCDEWIEVVYVSVDTIKSVWTRSAIGREFDAFLSPNGKIFVLFHSECGKTVDYTSEFTDFFEVNVPSVSFPSEWINESGYSVDNKKSKIVSPLQLLQDAGVTSPDLKELIATAPTGIPCGVCSSHKRTTRCGFFAVTSFIRCLITAVCKSQPHCNFVLQFSKLFEQDQDCQTTCTKCIQALNPFELPL